MFGVYLKRVTRFAVLLSDAELYQLLSATQVLLDLLKRSNYLTRRVFADCVSDELPLIAPSVNGLCTHLEANGKCLALLSENFCGWDIDSNEVEECVSVHSFSPDSRM